jgi:hypothetical protein
MSHRWWNIAVLVTVVGISSVTVIVNREINLYGLFGNVKGKNCLIYDNERTTKFLLSYNYIPSNFDGLLIGSSISDNWNTAEFNGHRVYNASINGGNISEETLIVNNVLERSRPAIVIFVVHPYLTESYGRKSGYMNAQEYWGALGSIQLLRAYFSKWRIEHGRARMEFNEFGYDDYDAPTEPPADLSELTEDPSNFPVNEKALQQYADLVHRAHEQGLRIAAVIPPVRAEDWNRRMSAYRSYYARVLPLFHEPDVVIDLNSVPDLQPLRQDESNFPDGVHLSRPAALRVSRVLGNLLADQSEETSSPPH